MNEISLIFVSEVLKFIASQYGRSVEINHDLVNILPHGGDHGVFNYIPVEHETGSLFDSEQPRYN